MNILNRILSEKRIEVKELKSAFGKDYYRRCKYFDLPVFHPNDVLKKDNNISIIAEVKKASPSKGVLRNNFNPTDIANIYQANGASALSVLTDRKFFQGDINYLDDIAAIKTIPLLRKDFILDEIQVFQSKAYGADIILLIAEVLTASQIKELTEAAKELCMDVLLEVHSEDQLGKIDFSRNTIIGINNRDLNDFTVSLDTTVNIADMLPSNIIIVSESGIRSLEDINYLKESNVSSILVGEHFMVSGDIRKSIKEMKEWCRREN